jgi:hypothetical protein
MKQIVLILVLSLVVFSANAFAEYAAADSAGNLAIGSTITGTLKVSKGVSVDYAGDSTAGLGYVIGAYHSSGTRTFASSSGDAKIWYQDGTAVAIPTDVPVETESADFSAWTAL